MPPSLFSCFPASSLRSSRLARLRSLTWWAGPALTVLGCSGSDSTAAVAPAGPPVLGIQSLRPAGGRETTPDDARSCLPLGRDTSQTLTVVLVGDPAHPGPPPGGELGTIKNWTLEPPFACVGTPQCGYVLVTVDPGEVGGFTVASVAVAVDIPMARLHEPTGAHTLIIELRNSDGTRAKDAKGAPYQVTVPVQVSASCGDTSVDAGGPPAPPPADSGADASSPGQDAGHAAPDAASILDAGSRPDASPLDAATARSDAGPRDH